MSVLDDLVNGFASNYDCKVDMLKNGLGGSITLQSVSLRIMYQPWSDLLVFHLPVGLLPEEDVLRNRYMCFLLKSNDFFSNTKGMTLGYNEEADLITLQDKYDINKVNQEKFDILVLNIFSEGLKWMDRLDLHNFSRRLNTDNIKQDDFSSLPKSSSDWLSI